MKENELDSLVTPRYDVSPFLTIGGFPGISVLAGYDNEGIPFGKCFGGLKGFEHASKIRKPPSFKP